ncbi:MAG: hypothetical protein AUJ39_02190 [Parcubacteria group bacterium CG1_02_42_13]|nr:MAG: hypothetical protein AUJ39_02190 [Parcubacteria group bacterium CG1_02_42_13]HCX27832.1 hypothetical protein [Candidatus Portnoybacteria bacterium]
MSSLKIPLKNAKVLIMTKKLAAKIKGLPQKPGAYLFKDASGRILYIGKAINLKNRVRSHFAPLTQGGVRELDIKSSTKFIGQVADVDFVKTENESQALIMEDQLIKKYQPRYNIQWRDDKSYFWVAFTGDEWPRVKIVHQTKLKNPPPASPDASRGGQPSLRGGSKNSSPPKGGVRGDFVINPIGPFVNGAELKQVLRALRQILPYRTCKNSYDKPCLQWHLGLCPTHKSANNKQSTINNGLPLNTYHLSLVTLRQLLRFYAGEPIRIEAYDISNIHGAYATGSMIVFAGNKPKKSDYRRFKIKNVRGANDVAMLKEVLRRRLNHPEWPYPDLMLIDGGKAQLNAANLSLNTEHLSLPLVALAKKDEEIYTEYSNKTLKLRSLPISLQLIFQTIRNEAHRFAIFYYRHLHAKQFRKTPKRVGKKS